MNISVSHAGTLDQAMKILLGDANIDLIVANDSEHLTLLMKYLLSVESSLPVIIVGATQSANEADSISAMNVVAQIRSGDIAAQLPGLIQSKYKDLLQATEKDEKFCRISVDLLCDITPLADDVYIRLSNIKFVKIFKAGTVFTEKDLKRLCGVRNIEYLYVPKAASAGFVNRLQDRLQAVSDEAEDGDEKLIATVAQVQETLQDLTQKIGFTEPVMALAKTHVELAVKAIGKFPRLHRIFEGSMLRNSNYTSRHSVMIAHVACAIASKLNWPSDSTFQKLIVASLLHDISLVNPDYCEINTKADLEQAKMRYTSDEIRAIENHPFAAADIVGKLHEIPADVHAIVIQHHEKPDGSGFPRGMRAQAIAPLAAVFIVAHELVEACDREGASFDMSRFWQERTEAYSSSTFKKIAKVFLDASNLKAA
ncbi:MAG TPA: HD domain-containing phosphohydrolase [Bdellovibrionales bacterium]|nr:HD domain-containing phosphohydrolase [Bdellovibrionales bacterium]